MENNLQHQIDELNQKMDTILQLFHKQRQQSEMVDDLVNDLAIVGKDAFQTMVDDLSVQNIQVRGDEIRYLVYKFLANIRTFAELLEMMESLMDLLKDLGPVVHDGGIAITHWLESMEKKGYFRYLKQLQLLAAEVKEHITEEDLIRLRENMPTIGRIVRNLTHPQVLNAMAKLTDTLSTMKMDPKQDPCSIFGLVRMMNKPEVRRTLSFTLRIAAELGKVDNSIK